MIELPKDFDRALWLDPLMFEGLVGAAIASGLYTDLFRSDGFAKPIAELAGDQRISRLMARVASRPNQATKGDGL